MQNVCVWPTGFKRKDVTTHEYHSREESFSYIGDTRSTGKISHFSLPNWHVHVHRQPREPEQNIPVFTSMVNVGLWNDRKSNVQTTETVHWQMGSTTTNAPEDGICHGNKNVLETRVISSTKSWHEGKNLNLESWPKLCLTHCHSL